MSWTGQGGRVITDPYEGVGAAVPWPPPDSMLSSAADLPGPAYVVSRVAWRQVLTVMMAPPLLYLALFRMVGHSAVPLSRLVNPGILGLLVVLEGALAGVCLARRGRATVVGTNDWIAVRSMLGRHWRQQFFAEVDRFSSRNRSQRGRSRMAVVTMANREGRRVSLVLDNRDPAIPALLGRLRSAGAREVDRRELAPMSRRRTGLVLAVVLGAIGLPVGYVAVGPLRLLPPSIAGTFTWSGCRASLAVEGQRPEIGTPYVAATVQATGETWRLLTTRQESAFTFVQHTQDPAARLAHLRRDGFLVAYQAYLQNATGAVVDMEMLRFTTAEGAQAYDTYVNRSVCEEGWHGRSGPRPTEVYLHQGKAALVRWIGGDSIVEVRQTDSTPFSTPQQVQSVAAALLASPGSTPGPK